MRQILALGLITIRRRELIKESVRRVIEITEELRKIEERNNVEQIKRRNQFKRGEF